MICALNFNSIINILKSDDPFLLYGLINLINNNDYKINIFIFKDQFPKTLNDINLSKNISINLFRITEINKFIYIKDQNDLEKYLLKKKYTFLINIYKKYSDNINFKHYYFNKNTKKKIQKKISLQANYDDKGLLIFFKKVINNLQNLRKISETNSKVYSFNIENCSYILKKYNDNESYVKEKNNLQLLSAHGVDFIPEILIKSDALKMVIFKKIKRTKNNVFDIKYIENYSFLIKKLNRKNIISSFLQKKIYAKEPCFSVNSIIKQIDNRKNNNYSILKDKWIDNFKIKVDNYLSIKINQVHREFKKNKWELVFNTDSYIYNQNDLGVNNLIISKRKFFLIDFEYGGIDTIYKLINDFKIHPLNMATFSQEIKWEKNIKKKLKITNKNIEMSRVLYPLFAIRWIYIIIFPIIKFKIRNKLEIKKRKNNAENIYNKLIKKHPI